MDDTQVQAWIGKPVRVTLSDAAILAGTLHEHGTNGHGHKHYMVVSDPVREGGQKEAVIIHGAQLIAEIVDASDDPSAIEQSAPLHNKKGRLVVVKSKASKTANRGTPGISADAIEQIADALNGLIANLFSLYIKVKNFHWHVSGPHFRDYHLLYDEQADAILKNIDVLAERVRKIGAKTVRSIGQIAILKTIDDNDDDDVLPAAMLIELIGDLRSMISWFREAHVIADTHDDVATASVLENFIDETEKHLWFLNEAAQSDVA